MKSSSMVVMPPDSFDAIHKLATNKVKSIKDDNPDAELVRSELPNNGFSFAFQGDDRVVGAGSLTKLADNSYLFVHNESEPTQNNKSDSRNILEFWVPILIAILLGAITALFSW
jgi:hypothetical protein